MKIEDFAGFIKNLAEAEHSLDGLKTWLHPGFRAIDCFADRDRYKPRSATE